LKGVSTVSSWPADWKVNVISWKEIQMRENG
jgi:hypothetical protein